LRVTFVKNDSKRRHTNECITQTVSCLVISDNISPGLAMTTHRLQYIILLTEEAYGLK